MVTPTFLEHEEDAAEYRKGSENTQGENDPVQHDLFLVLAGLLHKAHDLESDHRKHAGHQVEDESAEKHAAEDGHEATEADRFGFGFRCLVAA